MEFDYKKLTLDGKPMSSEDVILIVAQYHNMHPEEKLWEDIVNLIVGSNYTGIYFIETRKTKEGDRVDSYKKYCLVCERYTKHIRINGRNFVCTDHA